MITFTPGPGVDAIRSLRLLLKAAKRRFGLVAVDAFEDRSAPLQINNQVADQFRELARELEARLNALEGVAPQVSTESQIGEDVVNG